MERQVRMRWVERLREEFLSDSRVKAIWLGGSLGRGAGDAWSDVDFYVAVEETEFESFFAEVPERIRQLHAVLHQTDFAFRRQSLTERVWFFWFEGWPVQWKLDFHVHTTRSARGADPDQRRELVYGEWQVFYDPDSLLTSLPPVERPVESRFKEHVQERVDHVAWNFALASVAILREDFWQACSWLQALHDRIFYLLAIEAEPAVMGDAYPRRLAKVISPAEGERLQGAAFDRTRASMEQAWWTLLNLFAETAQRLCQQVGAVYPRRYVEAVRHAFQ